MIYTTNAIEALNRQLRKAIKTKGHFPNEDPLEAHLPRDRKRRAGVDPNPQLDDGATGVQDPFRRPTARLTINPAHTESRTPSTAVNRAPRGLLAGRAERRFAHGGAHVGDRERSP